MYFSLLTVEDLREELPEWLFKDAWEGEGDIIQILEELPILEQHLPPETRDSIEEYLGVKESEATVS